RRQRGQCECRHRTHVKGKANSCASLHRFVCHHRPLLRPRRPAGERARGKGSFRVRRLDRRHPARIRRDPPLPGRDRSQERSAGTPMVASHHQLIPEQPGHGAQRRVSRISADALRCHAGRSQRLAPAGRYPARNPAANPSFLLDAPHRGCHPDPDRPDPIPSMKEKDPCNFSLFSPSEPTEVKEMKESWVKLLHRGGFVLGAILLVAGCATDDPEPPADRTVEKSVKTPPAAQQRVPPAEPSADTLEKAVPPHATGDEAVSPEQKVIYRADVNLRVSRFDHVREQLEKEARKMEGYLVNGSESRGDQTLRGTLVFRIPQDRFQDFLAVLEKWAVEMPSKQINGTDVSEEYVDLKSRLRAKQAVEKRLLELMKQAEKPED